MRFFLTFVLIGLCGEAQEVKPYLRIETGSHTAKVYRIDVDAAERYLVSASDDKTARVWDLKTGKLLRVLRPPIGDFDEGKLYAVAISPDGSSVAIGGFTGVAGSDKSIYIFDRESGAIRHTVSGLPNVTHHLAFSRDGRFLAAALGGSKGIRIFGSPAYSEVARDASYGAGSYWIEFDQAGRFITTSDDGFVRLYGSDFKMIAKVNPKGGKEPFSARFSPDGKNLAVGFNDTGAVDVLSGTDLKFAYKRERGQAGGLSAVSWSADGTRLCAAGRYQVEGVHPVVCASGRADKRAPEFPAAGNTIMDLRALRDGSIVFCASDGTVAVLGPNGTDRWRVAPDQLDYRLGTSGLRLSPGAVSVELPAKYFESNAWTRFNLFFSASDRILEKNGAKHTLFLSPSTEGLAVRAWENEYHPTLNGSTLELKQYERSRSLAISQTKDTFVLGTEWYIRHFDRQGKRLWNTLVPGTAWAVNISSDKRYVIAALGDGTIRWYTLDKGEEVLALFVDHTATKWVAWNPDGFFAFDGGGDAFIGYHLNRGPGEAGEFIKVDQLREVFYRPDLISQILKPEGAKAVLEARNKIGDISAILAGGPPPEVELISPATADVTDDYRLEFRINDRGRGHGRVVYRIDGAEIEGKQMEVKGSARDTVSARIPVGSGDHKVEVAVYSAKGTIQGPPQTIHLSKRLAAPQANLYLIAAGVSHYSDHSLDGGVKFAAEDADLLAATFKQQKGRGLYGDVYAVSLPDRLATLKNIQGEVAKVAKLVRPTDTFVLFFSGHGMAVDGEYYFIPWEAKYTNRADLLRASLSREAIEGLLKQIPARKTVLILDTCDAGAALPGKSTTVTEKAAVEKVARMSGRAILAASNTNEMALSGLQNLSVFTSVLLEGLKQAQTNANGEISIAGLAEYVQSRVPDITEQKWHYRQSPLSRIEGEPFPIARK